MKEFQSKTGKQQFILIICSTIFLTWSGIQSFLLYWYNLPFPDSFIDSIVSGFVFSISCYIIANALHFYQLGKEKYFSLIVWVLFLGAASVYSIKIILKWIMNHDNYDLFIHDSLPLRFLAGSLLIGCTAIITVLWNSKKNQQENDQRKHDGEKLAREAELFSLRQQLQPHFLFNSLNSIVALITSQPEKAKEMVFQLSDYLRSTLRKDDQQLIPLSEEIEHLELYLEIEKVRFGHRMEVELHIPENLMDKKLPTMIIQPLLENAIKHGLYDTIDKVKISIEASLDSSMLTIKIINPIDHDNKVNNLIKNSGFGLRSVERRLFLIYGRNDLLKTSTNKETFLAHLKVPQKND